MILKGILDRSLSSQLCIRGFAPIKELARISKADYSYQRNPIYLQEKEIQTFLDEEEYLFFPEVILSYQVRYDTTKRNARKDLTSLQILETEGKFKSNIDNSSFRVKNDILKIVELTLDDTILEAAIKNNNHPFHRVDGNHRLKAAESATSDKVNRMFVPFCIILSEYTIREKINPDGTKENITESKGEKFEKVVFHNINTKTIPLTSEENLRVILDDINNFPDDELKTKFGKEYLLTRQVYKDLPQNLLEVYPNLGEEFCNNRRTFSKEVISLLIKKKDIKSSELKPTKIRKALKDVNQSFGNYKELENIKCIGIIECAIYLQVVDGNLTLFINWLIENRMTEINSISASSLIDIYEKIRESKSKQIFVSMQFDDESQKRYKAIKEAVEEINSKYKLDIKLREIRIDKFNEGYSYKIDDKILQLIDECGLLIADLTTGNKNVYHELGFLMGLNQGNGRKQCNFILLEQMTEEKKESDIGFNIRAFQQLRFKDTLELKNMLVDSLKEYYKLK